MESIRLLQIGDIHFPEWRDQQLVDWKDTTVPSRLVRSAVPNRLQNAMRKAVSTCASQEISGLLFCGDLTSIGQLGAYRECVDYIIDNFRLREPGLWAPAAVNVVPGNHDIDRRSFDPNGPDIFAKFEPLVDAWANRWEPILVGRGVRASQLGSNGCSAGVFSMNSCVGCGEQRFIPAPIQNVLSRWIARFRARNPIEAEVLFVEQLDTPSFEETHVTEVCESVEQMAPDTVVLILAHHNLLQQATPRIDLYTDVINGGLVRSRLASRDRPVLYCHGHIHKSPIEVVTSPAHPAGALVSIAAPLFVDGFNILELHFSRAGRPLGCTVRPFKSEDHGGMEESQPTRIPLVPAPRAPMFIDDLLRAVIGATTEAPVRFAEIAARVREAHPTAADEAIAGMLLEAEWLGITEVKDRSAVPAIWVIRRTGP